MNNSKKPEILAPAGGAEQLVAAVRCGADAVYLGTKNFNARNGAANFDSDTLAETVAYCHARNIRVYVTMNTLVTDDELADVKSEMKKIAESGVDAVIVQDLAVAALWRECCPEMKLNASTQMTIHNVEGVKAAEKLGFSRVVLARELSFEEIKKIKENTNAEIEVFVHGALCMSVSGTCLLSSMIGGRSGNRGRCAQPCRLDFNCNGREYALSLKDLSLCSHIEKLRDAGVDSLKIEGRMKRPEYVAAAVTAVSDSLAGKPVNTEMLRSVFSRSGFTDGYFVGKRDLSMFGHRRHEDVTAAAPVLKELAGLYKDEKQKVKVGMRFYADEKISTLEVSDGKNTVAVAGSVPQKAVNRPIDAEYVERFLKKTGGTPFYPETIECETADGLSIPASELNAMRRDALDRLYAKRCAVEPKNFNIKEKQTDRNIGARLHGTKIRLRFEKAFQMFDDERIDKVILPLSELLRNPDTVEKYGKKLVCEMPSLVFAENEESFVKALGKLKDLGVKNVIADNIGVAEIALKNGFTVHGGHGLNVLNSVSLSEYLRLGVCDITVSPELNMEKIAALESKKAEKGVLGYGYLPLMRFRTCPAKGANGCRDCKGLTVIKDRFNTPFYILCSGRKYSSLLNSVPLYIGDKNMANVDFVTLYFTFEPAEKCKEIFSSFIGKRPLKGSKTGGLYYRELL